MYLGIEIGGTKLQLGVGTGQDVRLAAFEVHRVDRAAGAEGIRGQIRRIGARLAGQHRLDGVGIGFGGPVNPAAGRIVKSFHIEGWTDFALADWCAQTFQLPCRVGNDADVAGLGEALLGAGQGHSVVLYSNCGSGIGGALVIDGALYRGGHGFALEIGHLRPGLAATEPAQTVESLASGWGIAAAAARRLRSSAANDADVAELVEACHGQRDALTAADVAGAMRAGNRLAREVFREALQAYGWALAQAVTLLGPNVVVLAGGVARVGREHFLTPLQAEIDRYVMAHLRGTYEVLPAQLGDEVVVHGALALAAGSAPG